MSSDLLQTLAQHSGIKLENLVACALLKEIHSKRSLNESLNAMGWNMTNDIFGDDGNTSSLQDLGYRHIQSRWLKPPAIRLFLFEERSIVSWHQR
jgi:hypothetical protein